MTNNEILNRDDVNEFKNSLICTLSLSSKELFHSNMLGWLLENNLDFARKFLGEDSLSKVEKVEREKANFDLLVSADGKNYIIENKVKSLPDSEQIKQYKNKAQKFGLNAQFTMLSLISPNEQFCIAHPDVRVISYEDIYKWIYSIDGHSDYTTSLLKDYGLLLSILLKIKSASKSEPNEILRFDKSDEDVLREIRLFDVAQKIRISLFAQNVDAALRSLCLPNYDQIKLMTEVSLTRSMGLMSLKFAFQKNDHRIFLGIEIQNDQYRLFVESCDKLDVQKIAEELAHEKLWLDPDNNRSKKILKFGKIFKYKYSSIKGTNISEVIKMIENDVKRLFESIPELDSRLSIKTRNIN